MLLSQLQKSSPSATKSSRFYGPGTKTRRQTQREQWAAQKRAGNVFWVIARKSPKSSPVVSSRRDKGTALCTPHTGKKGTRPLRRLGASPLCCPLAAPAEQDPRALRGLLLLWTGGRGPVRAPPTHATAEMKRLHYTGMRVALGDLHSAGLVLTHIVAASVSSENSANSKYFSTINREIKCQLSVIRFK